MAIERVDRNYNINITIRVIYVISNIRAEHLSMADAFVISESHLFCILNYIIIFTKLLSTKIIDSEKYMAYYSNSIKGPSIAYNNINLTRNFIF